MKPAARYVDPAGPYFGAGEALHSLPASPASAPRLGGLPPSSRDMPQQRP